MIDNKSRIESIINRIFILYMMLERNREKEEEGIEKIGQKKRARYVRPLKKLNHPHHPAFENIPALDMVFE